MPWAAGQNPGQSASPSRGKGSSSAQVFLPSVNLTRSSEAVGEEEEEERGDEKETTFIEPPSSPQLRARPLSPLVVHSRGEEDEGGEEGEDCSTEETPEQVRILSFLKYQGLTTGG